MHNMTDKCIIAMGKPYSVERCAGNVTEGEVREMYVFNLLHGVRPSDQVERGIRDTYHDLRLREQELANAGIHNPSVVPIRLVVGDEDALETGKVGM